MDLFVTCTRLTAAAEQVVYPQGVVRLARQAQDAAAVWPVGVAIVGEDRLLAVPLLAPPLHLRDGLVCVGLCLLWQQAVPGAQQRRCALPSTSFFWLPNRCELAFPHCKASTA